MDPEWRCISYWKWGYPSQLCEFTRGYPLFFVRRSFGCDIQSLSSHTWFDRFDPIERWVCLPGFLGVQCSVDDRCQFVTPHRSLKGTTKTFFFFGGISTYHRIYYLYSPQSKQGFGSVNMGVSWNGGTLNLHPKCWSFLVGKPWLLGTTILGNPHMINLNHILWISYSNPLLPELYLFPGGVSPMSSKSTVREYTAPTENKKLNSAHWWWLLPAGGFKYFWNFHPEPWGWCTQFDGSTTN